MAGGDPSPVGAGPQSPGGGLRLVPLGRADRDLVRGWLSQPASRGWWGAPGAAEALTAIAFDSDRAICRMIECSGEPVGYAHAIAAEMLGAEASGAFVPGIWECAVLVASEAHRGRGVGGAALRALAAEVFATTLAMGCVVRVAVRHERAVRAIEAAGFRWVSVGRDWGLGPVWLMRLDRPQR